MTDQEMGLGITPAKLSENIPQTLEAAAARDDAMLRNITGLVNTPEFREGDSAGEDGRLGRAPGSGRKLPVPALPQPGDEPVANSAPSDAALLQQAGPVVRRGAPAPQPVPQQPPQRIPFQARIFTTGRLTAGKDTFLNTLGCKVHGFADPLYKIQSFFFPGTDKASAGARAFLQAVGQWGRGTVSEQYPLTAARAVFIALIRSIGKDSIGYGVKWSDFGVSDMIWVNALISRVAGEHAQTKIGVSNVRFENERKSLTDAGFTHYHIISSAQTLRKRQAAQGISPNSPVLSDVSEQYAAKLDAQVLETIRATPTGPKLRAVWMDNEVAPPSPRLITRADVEASRV